MSPRPLTSIWVGVIAKKTDNDAVRIRYPFCLRQITI